MSESSLISPKVFKSVVKIFAIHCRPFYYQPWEMNTTFQTISSGFILSIDNREILCNAHGVVHATSIRIRKYGESKKYSATVKYVGHEWDLAILTVKDDRFWQNVNKIEMHNVIPTLQDRITVLGYPTGGDTLSVTKGVVSRIGFVIYDHALQYLLAIQIDAAINAGNSGGPCLNTEGNVVGVAFQIASEADNVGYCIPYTVIDHFIRSQTANIDYRIPDLGVEAVCIENYSLKQYLKMVNTHSIVEKELEGILVTDIEPFTDAKNKLQKHDVILEIDDRSIADDGTIALTEVGKYVRVHFSHVITSKLEGESVKLKILRDGQIFDIDVTVVAYDGICPVTLYDIGKLEYYIFGGLVFLPLSRPYLQSKFGEETWSQLCPVTLKYAIAHQRKECIDEQVIILSQVLPSETTEGYHDASNMILNKINGEKVRNMRQLAETIDDLVLECYEEDSEKFVTFEFDEHDILVLNVKDAIGCMPSVMSTHKIDYDRSPNLRKDDELGVCEEEIECDENTELVYDEKSNTYSITLATLGGSLTINMPADLNKNNVTATIDHLIEEIDKNT